MKKATKRKSSAKGGPSKKTKKSPQPSSSSSSSSKQAEVIDFGRLLDVDGTQLTSFSAPSSTITLTISGVETKLEAQVSPQSLWLIQHQPGNNFPKVKSKRLAALRNELEKRKDDLLALEKQLQKKNAEIVKNGFRPGDQEDMVGLLGVQHRHSERIREIEEMEEMTLHYQSWSGVRVELVAGVLSKVEGLATVVMFCPPGGELCPELKWDRIEETTEVKTICPRMHSPRHIYAVGGGIEDGASVERYDVGRDGWDSMAPMSHPRRFHGLGVMFGLVYAVGGLDNIENEYLSLVECYDESKNSWETVASMSCVREGCGVGVLDDHLYAVGGFSDVSGALSSVERYDAGSNSWQAVAPMSCARYFPGVAVLDNRLYAVGGCDDDYNAFNSVERYDPSKDSWEAVAPMSYERAGLGVAVLDGLLYAVGGADNDANKLSFVERYHPSSDHWEIVNPMSIPRGGSGVAVLGGQLYAAGGYDSTENELSSVERYDPRTNSWKMLGPMLEAHSCFGLVAL